MSTPHYSTPVSSSLHPENDLSSPNVLDYSPKPYNLEDSRNSLDKPSPLGYTPSLDNPHLKHIRDFYAKTSPLPPLNPIIHPLFPTSRTEPHGFFLPREPYIPKHPIPTYTPRYDLRQPYTLNPTPYLINPPIPSWKDEIGEKPSRLTLEDEENQLEEILNNLDEIFLDLLEKIEKGHNNNNLDNQPDYSSLRKTLQENRFKIAKIQKNQMKHHHKIAFARFRICTLEKIIDNDEENLENTNSWN